MISTSQQGLLCVPLHAPLSAKYKETFAYPTIKDRCPVILCKIIDHLHRQRINLGRELGPEAAEGLYKVVEELSKLRYEMQTDKPIVPIEDSVGNAAVWNKYLQARQTEEEKPSWFSSAWLWVECYMYRRVLQSLNLTGIQKLRDLDFFRHQKEEGFHGSLSSMQKLATWLLSKLNDIERKTVTPEELRQLWQTLVQVCLWGNRCDLSISAGSKAAASGDPVSSLEPLRQFILADESEDCWRDLTGHGDSSVSVSIVMDNSGFELFTDLCLADFLVTSGAAGKVRMRIKDQPWFVSDTTTADITWTLGQLTGCSGENEALSVLAGRWQKYFQSSVWTSHADSFWTFPHTFNEMLDCDQELYTDLQGDQLVIFKGDLNYRKLVGDLNWETTATFPAALRGFRPSRVLAVRTAKADVMVGLQEGQAEDVTSRDDTWMVTGQWGVIQYAATEDKQK